MIKITKFCYDIYELAPDFGSGVLLNSKNIKNFNGAMFKSVYGALKTICAYLNTAYHKYDWCFEENLGEDGKDGWVLHIIVDKNTHKWASEKMIDEWKNNKRELVDLLVNVFVDESVDK